MLFGSFICKLRKYHKYSYYYSGECITCGKIRKEHEKKQELMTEKEEIDSEDKSVVTNP
ncbi:hypothetical protein [Bacillus sp. B1-b2]|uniref:hypothetical protein n=1 Tax=Bacillus sp. B1-b2 TaxID=2653201 RepID=UPI001869A845|nr:hypothetical protein [Bacillus sp. B1-b2]